MEYKWWRWWRYVRTHCCSLSQHISSQNSWIYADICTEQLATPSEDNQSGPIRIHAERIIPALRLQNYGGWESSMYCHLGRHMQIDKTWGKSWKHLLTTHAQHFINMLQIHKHTANCAWRLFIMQHFCCLKTFSESSITDAPGMTFCSGINAVVTALVFVFTWHHVRFASLQEVMNYVL